MGTGEHDIVIYDTKANIPHCEMIGDIALELISLARELPDPQDGLIESGDVSDYVKDRAAHLLIRLNTIMSDTESQPTEAA